MALPAKLVVAIVVVFVHVVHVVVVIVVVDPRKLSLKFNFQFYIMACWTIFFAFMN